MQKATILLFALLMSTCSKPPTALQEVVSSGELRVITRNSPTTFYEGAVGFDGPEYQLVKGFAEHLDMRTMHRFATRLVNEVIRDSLNNLRGLYERRPVCLVVVHLSAPSLDLRIEATHLTIRAHDGARQYTAFQIVGVARSCRRKAVHAPDLSS